MPRDLHYIPDTFYRISDKSGFKTRSFDTEKEWTGRWVRRDGEFEPRQPQDLVQGRADQQSAPDPRPRPVNGIVGPLETTLAANAAAGASSITVESTVRMSTGDTIVVLVGLNDGATPFRTTISNVVSTTVLALASPLPQPAYTGALVSDLTASVTVEASGYGASNGQGPGPTGAAAL